MKIITINMTTNLFLGEVLIKLSHHLFKLRSRDESRIFKIFDDGDDGVDAEGDDDGDDGDDLDCDDGSSMVETMVMLEMLIAVKERWGMEDGTAIFRSPLLQRWLCYILTSIFDDGNPDYDYKEKEDDVSYVAIMMMTIKMRKGSK